MGFLINSTEPGVYSELRVEAFHPACKHRLGPLYKGINRANMVQLSCPSASIHIHGHVFLLKAVSALILVLNILVSIRQGVEKNTSMLQRMNPPSLTRNTNGLS